jgi:S-adenosylmethionine decarboxylase proenzyme
MVKKEYNVKVEEMMYLGDHYIIELLTDKAELLDDEKYIYETLVAAANAAKVTIISVTTHQFTPHGITGYLLLAESHISIHTWPEHGYAAVDVFTCGGDPKAAIEEIKKRLGARKTREMYIPRGV